MEAWSIARSMPRGRSRLFGMASTASTAIACLSAADIDRVMIEHL